MADTKKATWQSSGRISGNKVLETDDFYLSYTTGSGMTIIPMFGSDEGSDETALVVDGKFYILNGDFRREYEALVPKGVDACMAFFKKHKSQASSWSYNDNDVEAEA